MKIQIAFSLVVSALSVFSIVQPSFAGCGMFDPTCSPDEWTCPPGGCNPPSAPEIDVTPDRPQAQEWREVELRNSTLNSVSFQWNGSAYSLPPGQSVIFTYPMNSGYDLRWDYSFENGYQPETRHFAGEMDSWYEFQIGEDQTIVLY